MPDHNHQEQPPDHPEDGEPIPAADGAWPDPVVLMRRVRALLRLLGDGAERLADALVRAGLPPTHWDVRDPKLSQLSTDAFDMTLAAVLTRLTRFARETGPGWLIGDGAALDDFEQEGHLLGSVIRPLQALAARERHTTPDERGTSPLWLTLASSAVGAALAQVAEVLRQIDDLAPRLSLLTPEQWQLVDVESPQQPAPAVVPGPTSTIPLEDATPTIPSSLFAAGATPEVAAPIGTTHPATALPVDEALELSDAPTHLMTGRLPDARPDDPTVPFEMGLSTPPRPVHGIHRRGSLLVLAAAVLVTGITALIFTANPALLPIDLRTPATLTAAQATSAGQLAHAGTPTVTPRPTATPTPILLPTTPTAFGRARLIVSPNPLCPNRGYGVLTLSNIGGQTVMWFATPTSGITLSSYQGTLDPNESATLTVASQYPLRGSITFSWPGGAVKEGVRACH
jgi:hypothetical protein